MGADKESVLGFSGGDSDEAKSTTIIGIWWNAIQGAPHKHIHT